MTDGCTKQRPCGVGGVTGVTRLSFFILLALLPLTSCFQCYQCEGRDEEECRQNQALVDCGMYEEQECVNMSFTYIENFKIKRMFKRDCAIRPQAWGDCLSHHCLIALHFLSTDCAASCCKGDFCNGRERTRAVRHVAAAYSNYASESHSWVSLSMCVLCGQLILYLYNII